MLRRNDPGRALPPGVVDHRPPDEGPILTRRAVLATGVGIGATAAVAGAVGLHLGRDLPLELAAFAPLVGDRFRVTGEGTSHEVTLTGITGARGATASAAEFSLHFLSLIHI